jgi:serine/threonine protein kinase/tetratricopeptide (TPR) repeat protein
MIPDRVDFPEIIVGYDLLEKIGEGGAGIVYRATQIGSGRQVAVKTVRAVREGTLASLRREVQVLARIRHPGVITILDVGATERGVPWYAMELLEGRPLAAMLRGRGGLSAEPAEITDTTQSADEAPWLGAGAAAREGAGAAAREGDGAMAREGAGAPMRELLTIACKLCTPLAYLHGQGIVHRDLKPSNVFVLPTGMPVLFDFGMVRPTSVGGDVTLLDAQLARGGTAGYMAPEQIRGEFVDARADLYSLGCILYHVVTGRPAFVGTVNDVIQQQLHSAPERPSTLWPAIEPQLEDLILSLMEKQPSRRMGYAGEVAQILQSLGAEPWTLPDVPGPRPYVYKSPLVGRDEPLQTLMNELERARVGHASVVLVGGPSGIGKTTFSVEAARLARTKGFTVVAGECHPIGLDGAAASGPASLRAFSPFLRGVADRCLARGPAETQRLLGDRVSALATCEPRLSRFDTVGHASAAPALPGIDARRRMFDAVAGTLAASLDDGPMLLVIDDLQWADELSLRFLADLPPELLARPLLLLCTYRSEQSDVVEAVRGSPNTTTLILNELSPLALAMAVGAMLGTEGLNDPLVEGVTLHAGGNPFFAAELLLAAIAEGSLIRTPRGRWELSSGLRRFDDVPLPRALDDLIVSRIERLSPQAARVLGLAAIVGREVALEVLLPMAAAISPALGEDAVLDAVSELKAKQIFELPQSPTLRFAHDRLREVSYERIPAGERAALHLAAARILEERLTGPSLLSVSAATLAHHFERGGDRPSAVRYLEQAAEHARRSFSNTETIGFLRAALRLADEGVPVDVVRRARWYRLMGEAHAGEGHHAEGIADLHRAVELLGVPVPTSTAGVTGALLAEVVRQAVHRAGPLRLGYWRLRSSEPRLEAARAYDLLMPVTYYTTGSLPRILLASLRNLNLAERVGPSPELGLAYGNAQATAGLIPWHGLARTYERAARSVSEVISDEISRTWVLMMNAVYHVGLAHWDESRQQASEAREIAQRLQFHRRWEEATGLMGTIAFLSGQSTAALTLYEEQMRSALRGDGQTRIWAAAGKAQALTRLGRVAEARAAAEEAVSLLAGQGRPEQIFARGVLALASWADGDHQRALSDARDALRIIRAGKPISFYCVNAYASVAEVFVEAFVRGDAAARSDAEVACRELAASARIFPVSGPARELWAGRLAAARGRTDRAARAYERCVTLATGLAMEHERAVASALRSA